MIDVKQAVQKARDFVTDMYQDDKVTNIGLEEVIFDEENKEWLVTIGFDTLRQKKSHSDSASASLLERLISPKHSLVMSQLSDTEEYLRKYKIVRLNADSGEFNGMKIRQLASY